jgi:hypothetical protein
MLKFIILICIVSACSSVQAPKNDPNPITMQKEFPSGELNLATELLLKIYDNEMAPLECVPDKEEAALLLRTIRPRMEVVYDDTEAVLDNPKEVDKLINTCEQHCTCGFVDELIREHLVNLTRSQRKKLSSKKTDKELNRCMNYAQVTFCQSELFKTLNQEKSDFSFEDLP